MTLLLPQFSAIPSGSTGKPVKGCGRIFSPVKRFGKSAFTLVEMLVVLLIIAILVALGAPIISSLSNANHITRNAFQLTGALEQARSYATANNTYAWVGIFEEDADLRGVAGTGRVILSIVASTDGSRVYPEGNTNPEALDATRLRQVGELVQLEHCTLDTLTAEDVPRETIPAAACQVADDSFSNRGPIENRATFKFPLTGNVPTYTFKKIIQFSPMGDASKIVDSPVRCIEFGLRPAQGNIPDTLSKNLVAVQLTGIGGRVAILRPEPPKP